MGLQERLDALQPRERRLLVLFVGLFAAVALFAIPLAVSATLVEKRSENEQLQEALDRLFADRDEIFSQDDSNERILARYRTPAPALAGLIEKHAKPLELDIPEFKDRPVVPLQNKRYEERSTEIRIKKVGMRNLVLFMEKLAKERFPVSITKLSIRKRGTEVDVWDASMTVTAFHLSAEALAKDKSLKEAEEKVVKEAAADAKEAAADAEDKKEEQE